MVRHLGVTESEVNQCLKIRIVGSNVIRRRCGRPRGSAGGQGDARPTARMASTSVGAFVNPISDICVVRRV